MLYVCKQRRRVLSAAVAGDPNLHDASGHLTDTCWCRLLVTYHACLTACQARFSCLQELSC